MSPHGQLLLRFLREPAWCTGLTRCEGARYIEQYAGCSCGSAFGSRPGGTVLFRVVGALARDLDFIDNFPCLAAVGSASRRFFRGRYVWSGTTRPLSTYGPAQACLISNEVSCW